MLRILMGGSPCTHWSIAQKKDRETEAKGLGWDLFCCYLRAKEIYQPDFFLYENNWSAANVIKDKICEELDKPLIHINSALVSAQNRDRFYVTNIPNVKQPTDKGIGFKDIIEPIQGAISEPFCVAQRGVYIETMNRYTKYDSPIVQKYEIRKDNKGNALTTVCKDVMCGVRVKDTAKDYSIEVENKSVVVEKNEIKKKYIIDLPDGKYKIRNLTTVERRRLQTIPDWYKMQGRVSKDLRLLGNGWTVEVIKHILSNIPNIKKEEVEVLSMFDGMACGMIALKELGVNVVRYRASEIEEYAIETVKLNFPEIEQIGDAFKIEEIEELRK